MNKPIRFNAFTMNTVGDQSPGLWTHPRDRCGDYRKLDRWTELATLLERGLFDGVFIADVLGIYDVYGASPVAAIRPAVQVPVNDPLLIVPAMAAVTQNLGFGVTFSLTYEHPYPFARRMSTLDHLTGGRVGWNIVTGYLDSAARNLGLPKQIAHDERYDLADEYLDPRKSKSPSAVTTPSRRSILNAVDTARNVTPAQATNASSNMSPEHSGQPVTTGCRVQARRGDGLAGFDIASDARAEPALRLERNQRRRRRCSILIL